jgi:N utilization substance protein B
MLNKRKSRELAMQILFLWDANGEADQDLAVRVAEGGSDDAAVRTRALAMASGAWEMRGVSDQWLERLAPQWPPRRQPGVDRSLLRLAVWEMTSQDTPPKVVIDEAIEMAKEFSTENSPSFVNGVLDAVLREKRALIEGQPPSVTVPPPGENAAPESALAENPAPNPLGAEGSN